MFDDVICMDKYDNTVRSLAQWDLDQTLYIYNTNYPVAPMFHFSNQNTEKALVMQSHYNEGVLECVIPNQLMIEPYPITCYIYIPETEKGGTVVGMFKIPVRPRPEPNEFEYEDNVDIVNIRTLAAEIAEAEFLRVVAENERVSAENIRISNENTRISNENTRQSNESTRVSNEATRQTQYAAMVTATDRANTAAAGAETIISRYETDLADITAAKNTAVSAKNDAETAATNAETSETNAATSATNAATSATNAATSATNAANSATEASGYVDDAEDFSLVSEGWAVGTQGGEPVDPSSPYFHNSAEYWAGKAQAIAGASLNALSDVSISNPTEDQSLVYNATLRMWVNRNASHLDDAIADTFDPALNYSTGDVIIYNDKLYRFTEDHTAGPWDSSEVEIVSVEQLISEAEPHSFTNAERQTLIGLVDPL